LAIIARRTVTVLPASVTWGVEGDSASCPVDTVCKPIQGGPRRCLLICGSDTSCGELADCGASFCPSGSSCVEVGDTVHQACEPEP